MEPGSLFLGNEEQEKKIIRLFETARRNRLEFLFEIVSVKSGATKSVDHEVILNAIQRCYDLDVYPDWWKLEAASSRENWKKITSTINRNDPNTRGILILGLGSPIEELQESFRVAAEFPLVKGFAVGRSVFKEVADKWMSDIISDDDAIQEISQNYLRLCKLWDNCRK